MGRSCGHPRGLGVAFGPTLDPSRAGPMATPGSTLPPLATGGWLRGSPRSLGRPRGHPRGLGLARTWGWPSGHPFCRASLTVGFGLAVTASSNPDSGGFRPGRCGPARALVAFSNLGVARSVQTHVGGVGVGLAVAACSDPNSGSVVQYGHWRSGLAWAVPAASDLAVVVRIWAGAFSAWSRSGVSTTL
jgi:hypothetical protein